MSHYAFINWELVFLFCATFTFFIVPEAPMRTIDTFMKKWKLLKIRKAGRKNRRAEDKAKKYWEVNIRNLH